MDNLSFNESFGENEDESNNSPRFFKDQIINYTEDSKITLEVGAIIVGYPHSTDGEGSIRRMGSENGPDAINKLLKGIPFRPLDGGKIILNAIDYAGTDSIHFDLTSYSTKINSLLKKIKCSGCKPLFIIIGGGNDILSAVLGPLLLKDVDSCSILKISQSLALKNGPLSNETYLSHFNETFISHYQNIKMHHIGLVGRVCTNQELSSAISLGHETEMLESLTPGSILKATNLALLDCESFSSDYFHGISTPNCTGLNKDQALMIYQELGRCDNLEMLVISNFNPTIEKMRSGYYLIGFLYELLKTRLCK